MTRGTIKEPPKPFLVDNKRLGWQFRDVFIAGVERLQKAGKLKVVDSVDWARSTDKSKKGERVKVTCSGVCDELSPKPTQAQEPSTKLLADEETDSQAPAKKCPKCECKMALESATDRPSWRELFNGEHQPSW